MSKKPLRLLSPEAARDWFARRVANQQRAWLEGQGTWPLRLNLGEPTERDLADDLPGVRAWAHAWQTYQGPGQVYWAERRWVRAGTQRIPAALEATDAAVACRLAGQVQRWYCAFERAAVLRQQWPVLAERGGLGRHFEVLASWTDGDFDRLLAALRWFVDNPRSGLYLRQLPIAGLDTKWLEKRTRVVAEMLSLLREQPEGSDFYEVCGLARAPYRLRIKVLCPRLRAQLAGLRDIEAPKEELAGLSIAPRSVLVVENLETGVALPDLPATVAFMKLGRAVDALASVPWARAPSVLYWGDIDTHGLAILAKARRTLPETRSLLMDEQTLLSHRELWSEEPAQHSTVQLPELTVEERRLFDDLRAGCWGTGVRLEQERISWPHVCEVLRSAVGA